MPGFDVYCADGVRLNLFESGWVFAETGLVVPSVDLIEVEIGNVPGSVPGFRLGCWDVGQRPVEALVVEPADAFDDPELELSTKLSAIALS